MKISFLSNLNIISKIYLAPNSLLLFSQVNSKILFTDYMFPYLIIIVSVISNAVHFAVKLDQVREVLSYRKKPALGGSFIFCVEK